MEKPIDILLLEIAYNLTLLPFNNQFFLDDVENRNTYLLDGNEKVIYLNLAGNKISNISMLENLEELQQLNLSNNEITDISALKSFQKLVDLNLADNNISDVSILENLINITDLDLDSNEIFDFSCLCKMKNLNRLYVSWNNIPNISGISNLTELTSLGLSFNKINNITELKSLSSKLSFLLISGNPIIDYSTIKSLTELETLNLIDSNISDISILTSLKKLDSLVLNKNKIIDITPLKHLKKLTILSLRDNRVSNISTLKSLNKLIDLNLSQNRISDLNQFEFIDNKPKLRITADNNPCFVNAGIVLIYKENHYNAIVNELKKLEENKIEIILPEKVLLLGNHASGKSTLLDYLLQKRHPKNIKEKSISTEIVKIENFPRVLTKNKLPTAVFYDFGGQDYYHGLYKAFLSNDSINLLLWNKENDRNQIREDANGINTRDFARDYWLNQLKYQYEKNKQQSDIEPIILIQTHADKSEKKDSKREAYLGDCEYFNIENEFYVALNENAVNKSKVFASSLVYLENSILELIKTKQKVVSKPIWYDSFLNYILREKGSSFTMLSNIEVEYKRKQENKKFLPEDLDQLAKKGLILYYKNDNDLKDIAWLDPSETVKFIHKKNIIKYYH